MSEQEIITSFKKNSLEEVRIAIQEYKGRRYLSIWIWYAAEPEVWHPSKKGLNLPVELLPELKKAIDAALAKVEFEEEAKTERQTSETKSEEEAGNT